MPFRRLTLIVHFLTGEIEVCTGDISHSMTPAFFNNSKTGVIPSMASGLSGYCCWQGLKSDLGVITTGSAFLIKSTSCLP